MTLRVSFFIFFEILISTLIKDFSTMRIVQQTIESSILREISESKDISETIDLMNGTFLYKP